MARADDVFEFASSAFVDEPGEDALTNPGVQGRALARWLAAALRTRGLDAGEPIPEDFGWLVPVALSGRRLFIGCRNAQDHAGRWQVTVFPGGGFLDGIFFAGRRAAAIARLQDLLVQTLASHGVGTRTLSVTTTGAP